jgi:hypothetical protein
MTMMTMQIKLTPAQRTVLNEIATKGHVHGKGQILHTLRKAGLIEYGAVWPVIGGTNHARITDAGCTALGLPTSDDCYTADGWNSRAAHNEWLNTLGGA